MKLLREPCAEAVSPISRKYCHTWSIGVTQERLSDFANLCIFSVLSVLSVLVLSFQKKKINHNVIPSLQIGVVSEIGNESGAIRPDA